jgi:hypothetical protein
MSSTLRYLRTSALGHSCPDLPNLFSGSALTVHPGSFTFSLFAIVFASSCGVSSPPSQPIRHVALSYLGLHRSCQSTFNHTADSTALSLFTLAGVSL